MLTSAVNTLAKGLTSSAVEFTFKGNETEARQNLTPTTVLAATIQFGGGKVRGHHEGSRLLVSSKGFLKLFPKYTVEANGYGTFTSRELGYTGNFYHGKFHDQSGNAICTLGTDMKYHGSFQNGHASGHGVLTVFVGGKWYKAFDGEWKLSTPWTGDFFDADGNVGHVIHEGNVLSTIRNDTETSMTERKLELLTELKSLVEKKLSVSDRLSTVDIADLALRGDTSLLQLLRDIRELDAIPNINEISSIRLLDGTVEVCFFLFCTLILPIDHVINRVLLHWVLRVCTAILEWLSCYCKIPTST